MAIPNLTYTHPNFKDRTGVQYGLLTATAYAGKRKWVCRCHCGNYAIVFGGQLDSGRSRSCGCLQRALTSLRFRKHGARKTILYRTWCGIKDRCYNPNNERFRRYGGRGIQMCERWLISFADFKSDMGARPPGKLSLDRIDNNGNYEPGNCRWATAKTQTRNKSNNRNIVFRGETLCLSAWAERTGINDAVLLNRLRTGWSIERTLTTPNMGKRRCSLTEANIETIRQRFFAGQSTHSLALTYRVDDKTIRRFVNRNLTRGPAGG